MTQNQLPALARQALDRDYLSRLKPQLFQELAQDLTSRVLLISDGKARIDPANSLNLLLEPLAAARQDTPLIYLGKTTSATADLAKGSAICLQVIADAKDLGTQANSNHWVSLRQAGASLSDMHVGIFTAGLALANWHQSHTRCPSCGAQTTIEQAGWVRRCESEGTELFPRTDPAIIVSITDQHDRILLGSQRVWESNKWSVLAGFVEPGESLESAVIREMKEESGLDVSEPKYLYSQSWPYPLSLMLAFTAKADSNQALAPDGDEIVRLRWFSRAELVQEAAGLLLPGKATISRAMIELWLGSEITSLTETNGNGFQ